MPSKKHKSDPKDDDSLRPLSYYVKDRLELTRQLFSCLKKKQIKSRLPVNLQKKSIERIQQICLDEILGISSKRLTSIINNTTCPFDTDSDSEIEHISLSEISSDSDIEETIEKEPDQPAKKSADGPSNKSEKEMTMLELLELQARARAIRSQLALEPVTKIELDSDDDEATTSSRAQSKGSDTGKSTMPSKTISTEKNSKAAKFDDQIKAKSKTPEVVKSVSEKTKKTVKTDVAKAPKKSSAKKSPDRRIVILSDASQEDIMSPSKKISEPEKPTKKSAPVKLNRNFRGTELEGYPLSTVSVPLKEKTPPKDENESRSSSPDVVAMEQNISTYFISDSEDEKEPPVKKKSPSPRIIVQSIEIIPVLENKEPENESKQNQEEEVVKQQQVNTVEIIENEHNAQKLAEENITSQSDTQEKPSSDDENVVNIMSDTEIDLNVNSDKEEEDNEKESSNNENENEENITEAKTSEEPSQIVEKSTQSDYDDDVVEIHNTDDEIIDSDKPSDSAKNSDESETWEQRYLRSSKIKDVLKTTKLASKVRGKIMQKKKTLTAAKKDKEKEIIKEKERVANLSEGSMEQFNNLKDSNN